MSHADSAKSGLSIESQIERVTDYRSIYLSHVEWAPVTFPDGNSPGIFSDLGVSAFSKRFCMRPAGAAILEHLKSGDHVLFWSIDRGFRNSADCMTFLDEARKKKINLHFISEGIDLTTPSGRLKAQIFAAAAEHYSAMISVRTREALAIKKAQAGEYVSADTPIKIPARVKAISQSGNVDIIIRKRPTRKPKIAKGRVLTYTRCSHIESLNSGLGLTQQAERTSAYAKILAAEGYTWDGATFTDEVVSAYKVPFAERPQGKRLLEEAREGDAVVVYRLDRAFRNVKDAINTTDELSRRGIAIHFVEERIQSGSSDGMWYLQILSSIAELESRIGSERKRFALALRRKAGYRTNLTAPLGYRFDFRPDGTRVVLCTKTLAHHAMVAELRSRGFTWPHVSHLLEARNCAIYSNHKYVPYLQRPHKLRIETLSNRFVALREVFESLTESHKQRLRKKAQQMLDCSVPQVVFDRLHRAGVRLDRLLRPAPIFGIWEIVFPDRPRPTERKERPVENVQDFESDTGSVPF